MKTKKTKCNNHSTTQTLFQIEFQLQQHPDKNFSRIIKKCLHFVNDEFFFVMLYLVCIYLHMRNEQSYSLLFRGIETFSPGNVKFAYNQ